MSADGSLTGLNLLAEGAILSPFTRLNRMLADIPAGTPSRSS